ncbi:MAG TPA: DUF5615 family PIN-like protein [bacterium]|nr:DUF5615 family PIN-like protein [bacterium]HQQ00991.1 DUF5615 family PIN-like protein [bacterium]
MKIKLDENLGKRIRECFAGEGHDTETVVSEGLSGEPDEVIFEHCSEERRVLVTLDRDFGNIMRFHPERLPGTVILAVPEAAGYELLVRLASQVAGRLKESRMRSMLWIVEPGRIREWPAQTDELFAQG